MTDTYPPDSGPTETAGIAKEQAGILAESAASSASDVAHSAKDAATDVAGEARRQAADLLHQSRTELVEQAGVQQERVAAGLRALGEELGGMARASDQPGVAADLVSQAAQRADGVASWLDARDPGSLLREVKAFARRSPGTFIGLAALTGVVAGRLAKNLADSGPAGSAPSGAGAAPAPAHAAPSHQPSVAGGTFVPPAPVGDPNAGETLAGGYDLGGPDLGAPEADRFSEANRT